MQFWNEFFLQLRMQVIHYVIKRLIKNLFHAKMPFSLLRRLLFVSCMILYDLEKEYDSIEHPILLKCLFEAGLNGRLWRVIKACYDNIQVVVSSNSKHSTPVPFLRGVQQGSVLSPIFFLDVMDKILQKLEDENAGISICNFGSLEVPLMRMIFVLFLHQRFQKINPKLFLMLLASMVYF